MSFHKTVGVLCMLVLVTVFNVQASGCVSWKAGTFGPTTLEKPVADEKMSADSGIYWLKNTADDLSESAMPACQVGANSKEKKACLNKLKLLSYFNPNKPTIIFIHGWQPMTVVNKNRFDFCYNYTLAKDTPANTNNTLSQWKDWNVGVFYWNQYADEISPYDAEAKIYSPNGAKGMRWKYRWVNSETGKANSSYCSNKQANCNMPTNEQGEPIDIVQMAYQAYIAAMPSAEQYLSKNVRIAGQSLGTQIAIQLTGKLLFDPQGAPEPTRLALMDPYFTPDHQFTLVNKLPDSVANYNANIVSNILQAHPTFPITVFRTSELSQAPNGNSAESLNNQVAYIHLYPNYMYAANDNELQAARHIASIYLYFYSKKFSANPLMAAASSNYITAQSLDADVVNLMRQKRYQSPSLNIAIFEDFWSSSFTNQEPQP